MVNESHRSSPISSQSSSTISSPSLKQAIPTIVEFDVIDNGFGDTSSQDDSMEKELSRAQLALLTCTLGGLQVTWSVLNSNVNVFLTSIGIPKAVSSLIWIIAPLCGTFVQPIIGWWSDRTETRFGRRKPFIVFGSICLAVGLLGLFWTKYICILLSGMSEPSTGLISGVALVWVILTNVSVQPVQMGIRSLFVDGAPESQQAQVNAWGNTCLSVGNVVGYLMSFVASSISINVRGFSHYNLLSIVAIVCLAVTVTINLLYTKEEFGGPAQKGKNSPGIKDLFKHFRNMNLISRRVKVVYQVQFCAWLGWGPYIFYMVSFVTGRQEQDKAVAQSSVTQPGQLAAFLYAVVSCVGSLLIPQVLKKHKSADPATKGTYATIFGVSLEKVWALSQIFFAILMFCTALAFNTSEAIAVIALGGIPWSLSNYIPYALIGYEIARQRAAMEDEGYTGHSAGPDGSDQDSISPPPQPYHDDESQANAHGQSPEDQLLMDSNTNEAGEKSNPFGAGATTGLHNASLSAPQIFANLIAAGVLALTDKFNIGDGYGWVLRLAGLAALVSCLFIRKLFK